MCRFGQSNYVWDAREVLFTSTNSGGFETVTYQPAAKNPVIEIKLLL